jgi:hypothetical protein
MEALLRIPLGHANHGRLTVKACVVAMRPMPSDEHEQHAVTRFGGDGEEFHQRLVVDLKPTKVVLGVVAG